MARIANDSGLTKTNCGSDGVRLILRSDALRRLRIDLSGGSLPARLMPALTREVINSAESFDHALEHELSWARKFAQYANDAEEQVYPQARRASCPHASSA
jgi:hypothetical protein